jgi:cytochrome P450
MTFLAGPRSCIEWRFSVLELQAFLVELISTFEFSLPPGVPYESVRRESSVLMSPTIEGEAEKGVQLPFRIKAVGQE